MKPMQPHSKDHNGMGLTLSFYIKCGAIFLLFLLSVLIVACGGDNNTAVNLGGPVVTVTISIGQSNASPTPTTPNYWCGAWATQTTAGLNPNTVVGVYAKFTRNVNGNPEGVDGATATAVVQWPDGTSNVFTANTTPDGLAVFAVPAANKVGALNRSTLVTVTFTKPGLTSCVVDGNRAAFFTLVLASPTATASPTSTATDTAGTVTPTDTVTPRPRRTPTPSN